MSDDEKKDSPFVAYMKGHVFGLGGVMSSDRPWIAALGASDADKERADASNVSTDSNVYGEGLYAVYILLTRFPRQTIFVVMTVIMTVVLTSYTYSAYTVPCHWVPDGWITKCIHVYNETWAPIFISSIVFICIVSYSYFAFSYIGGKYKLLSPQKRMSSVLLLCVYFLIGALLSKYIFDTVYKTYPYTGTYGARDHIFYGYENFTEAMVESAIVFCTYMVICGIILKRVLRVLRQ